MATVVMAAEAGMGRVKKSTCMLRVSVADCGLEAWLGCVTHAVGTVVWVFMFPDSSLGEVLARCVVHVKCHEQVRYGCWGVHPLGL